MYIRNLIRCLVCTCTYSIKQAIVYRHEGTYLCTCKMYMHMYQWSRPQYIDMRAHTFVHLRCTCTYMYNYRIDVHVHRIIDVHVWVFVCNIHVRCTCKCTNRVGHSTQTWGHIHVHMYIIIDVWVFVYNIRQMYMYTYIMDSWQLYMYMQ